MGIAKVLVAMSGGVDSSVACLLLKEQGLAVVGATMCLGVAARPTERPACCGPEAAADARAVCDRLGVPHYVFDYSTELRAQVIEPFLAEYRAGRTPNPCVLCNSRLKFGSLLARATTMGFDAVATGHYARVSGDGVRTRLQRPRDRRKDQTYFLYALPRQALQRVLFPLAGLAKDEVRARAAAAGLPVAHKPESQDICFAQDGDYRGLLDQATDHGPGPFVDSHGRRLGQHRGISHYTIGQRKGLGLAMGTPVYVVAIRSESNEVVLGNRSQLLGKGLRARQLNWLVDSVPAAGRAMIRYTHTAAPCTLQVQGGELTVLFEEPQEAITPGQSVVVYDGDTVAGGGVIEASLE